MDAGPPVLMERLVRWLTPPAARESVAGDLWERYRSPWQYGWEAVRTLPFVIVSQVRRSSSLPVLGLQAFILFACLGGFAIDADGPPLWARAAIPTAAAFAGLVLRDAYRGTDRRSIPRALWDAVTAILCVATSQLVLWFVVNAAELNPRWMLPPAAALLGLLAIPMLCLLRIGLGLDGDLKPTAGAGSMTANELVREYEAFRKRIRWRTIVELSAGIFCMAFTAFFLWRFQPAVAPYGWAMLAGHAFAMACIAAKGWVRALPEGAAPTLLVDLYGRELARLRSMRRYLWWWYFVPLFVGLATNLIVPGITDSQPARILLGAATGILLSLCIAGLNHDRGRSVQEKINALAALRLTA